MAARILKKFDGEWAEGTAGGCINFSSAVSNPQYLLTVSEKPTDIIITLTQTLAVGDEPYPIGIIIADKGGERIKTLSVPERIASSGDFINTDFVECKATLQPRPTPYTVFVSTFNPNDFRKFTVTFDSDSDVAVSELAPYDALSGLSFGPVSLKGRWEGLSAGGCQNFPTFKQNPNVLIKLTGGVKTTLRVSLKQSPAPGGENATIGFLLANKGGKRIDVLYVGEEVASSGTYINSPEVHCVTKELEPLPEPYTLVVTTFKPATELDFEVEVRASAAVALSWAPDFVNPIDDKTHFSSVSGEWTAENAGGCVNHPTFVKNPIYELKVDQDTEAHFTLNQPRTEDGKLLLFGLCLCENYTTFTQRSFIGDSGTFRNVVQVSMNATLKAKDTPYILFPSTFDPDCLGFFSIEVHSTNPLTISPANTATLKAASAASSSSPSASAAASGGSDSGWQPPSASYPLYLPVPFQWKGPIAGGSYANSPSTFVQNPQFKLYPREPLEVILRMNADSADSANLHATIAIYDGNGDRIVDPRTVTLVASMGPAPLSTLHLTTSLEGRPYTVVCYTEQAGEEGGFVLELCCAVKKVTIKDIADDVRINQMAFHGH